MTDTIGGEDEAYVLRYHFIEMTYDKFPLGFVGLRKGLALSASFSFLAEQVSVDFAIGLGKWLATRIYHGRYVVSAADRSYYPEKRLLLGGIVGIM